MTKLFETFAATIGASVSELAQPANRPKLQFGIWSGYAVSLGFGVLAVLAALVDITPWRWTYLLLVSAKVATNSLAWFALARDRGVLATQGLNTIADVILLTAAMYFTGGPYSPLLPTYIIIITILSLLANLTVTLLMAGFMLACFSGMLALMTAGVLSPTPVPGAPGAAPSVGYTLTAIVYMAFVVGIPAAFSSATLRQLRRKEAALEARTAQLLAAATQRSQFVASMTHELRTPIHGVQGLSDVIAAGVYGPVTDKQKEACASIKRSAQSLLQLVDDVLQLTRAEANKIDAHPSIVDIAELVDRVSASVSWMVGTKQLHLETDVEPDLPDVMSDGRWLAHVLVNLLANAIKFTREGGRVTVRARRGEDVVVLEVEDTGIGIAAADRAAIFEPFRQAQHGDEKGYGGVGLGLALVARLTDLLACTVELDSVVGKGSTFRVIVPLRWRGRRTTRLSRQVGAVLPE